MSNLLQFIGYGIHTGPKEENENIIPLGLDTDILTRAKGEEKDYSARIELLKEALVKARNRSDIETDALKIFTVPDFYFSGRRKGYLQDSFFGTPDEKRGVLSALQSLMQGDDWKDWMLVVGANLVYTIPSKKKELEVTDIKIPFFRPKKGTETTVRKPVNLKNLTVVDAINLVILEQKLQAAFAEDAKIQKEVDNIESLASEVAYNLIEDPTTTGYENSSLKVIDTIGKKINKEVNNELKKIKTEEQMEELEEQYPFEWEKALDPNEEEVIFSTSLVIEGGFSGDEEAQAATTIIMKPFYNEVVAAEVEGEETEETTVKENKEQEVLDELVSDYDHGDVFLDPWQLIHLNGEIDAEKVARIKKNKKYGSPLLAGWNDLNTNPTHLEINSTGIVKIKELTFAIDSGLDHVNGAKKKLIAGMKDGLIKSISAKILSKEEQALYKQIIKGVDVHIITSCGSQLYESSVVARKGGWIFNVDGFGNMHQWEDGKLLLSPSKEIQDVLGYRNVAANEKTRLGNAHTGLMRTVGVNMKPGEESSLIPYGKKPKVERSSITDLDLQTLKLNNEKVKISDLFWEGALQESEIPAVVEKGAEESLNVAKQGPIGGAIIIYNEILLG